MLYCHTCPATALMLDPHPPNQKPGLPSQADFHIGLQVLNLSYPPICVSLSADSLSTMSVHNAALDSWVNT